MNMSLNMLTNLGISYVNWNPHPLQGNIYITTQIIHSHIAVPPYIFMHHAESLNVFEYLWIISHYPCCAIEFMPREGKETKIIPVFLLLLLGWGSCCHFCPRKLKSKLKSPLIQLYIPYKCSVFAGSFYEILYHSIS